MESVVLNKRMVITDESSYENGPNGGTVIRENISDMKAK